MPGSCPIGMPLPLLPPVCLCPLMPRLVTMTRTMRTPLRLPRAIMLSHGKVCFTHLLKKLHHFLIYLIYNIEQVRSPASTLQGRGPSHSPGHSVGTRFCSCTSFVAYAQAAMLYHKLHTTKTHVKPCDTTQHVSKQVLCLCRLFVQLIVQDYTLLLASVLSCW